MALFCVTQRLMGTSKNTVFHKIYKCNSLKNYQHQFFNELLKAL